jgi:hypothetical protein
MANYKYEVIFGNEGLSVKVNTLEEAEELKLAMNETAEYNNNVRIKRYWYMDELITQEDSNESK